MRARILKLSQPWEVFEFTNSNCCLYGWSFKKAPCYFISFIKRPLLEPHLHTFIRALSITSMPKIYYGNGVHCEDDEIMMGIFGLRACVICSHLCSSALLYIRWLIYLPDVSDQDLCLCVLLYRMQALVYMYLFIILWFLDEHQRAEVFVVYRTFIS